jgi:hypothetical protein
MQHRRSKSLLVLPVIAGLLFAACGSDEDEADETSAPTTAAGATPATSAATETSAAGSTPTTGGGEAASLAGVCPDLITLQTDWMPEAEHGFVYQLIGEDYEIDKANAAVEGPLVDSAGNDMGVRFRVQSGGGAQQFQSVTTLMYSNDDILLGYVYTDEAIQNSAEFPTIAIESGFEKNPQMIMWDPETYPDVKEIADLGEENVKIRYFGGAAYMDYFTSTGILSPDQVDGSYQGDPAGFIGDEGKAAQQGFGSAEPYLYENEIEGWGKPVAYAYINDAGWENYAESIATKPENIEKHAACFEVLVPMIQQASIDYLNDPKRTNDMILAAVDSFGGDFGWTYTQGTADYAVETIKNDGLVANGPDDIVGNFDMDRVNALIEKAIPVYTAQDSPPKEGLKAEDIVTNQFIDETIGL